MTEENKKMNEKSREVLGDEVLENVVGGYGKNFHKKYSCLSCGALYYSSCPKQCWQCQGTDFEDVTYVF